jgi:hypothetical protein
MVNPTGYTALDLVGYTDKGTYSNSANYVANDLVHYGGNIWRCKVDDTTGVAPVEGADWTLFIGEPTNMAERIIAPLEVSPSANAYAVGKQLIYNDTLYKAKTAIAVGDVLTVGTNIELADKITAQIEKSHVLLVNVNSFSALPQTVSNTEIESDMVVVNSLLSNPSAQTGDWTVTTTNGSLTVAGTISGTTTLTLYLMKSR